MYDTHAFSEKLVIVMQRASASGGLEGMISIISSAKVSTYLSVYHRSLKFFTHTYVSPLRQSLDTPNNRLLIERSDEE